MLWRLLVVSNNKTGKSLIYSDIIQSKSIFAHYISMHQSIWFCYISQRFWLTYFALCYIRICVFIQLPELLLVPQQFFFVFCGTSHNQQKWNEYSMQAGLIETFSLCECSTIVRIIWIDGLCGSCSCGHTTANRIWLDWWNENCVFTHKHGSIELTISHTIQ